MATHEQNIQDLAETLQRIADGEGYIARMEALLERATEREEATADLLEYLNGMRDLLRSFKANRDALTAAIQAVAQKDAEG
jgi:hypothetical protein